MAVCPERWGNSSGDAAEGVLPCKRRPFESALANSLSSTEEEVSVNGRRAQSEGQQLQTHLGNSVSRFFPNRKMDSDTWQRSTGIVMYVSLSHYNQSV